MKRSPTAKRVDVTGSLPDLTKRPTLYIDIDDTIIACIWDGSGFDLRPNIMTQLRVLKELYNVRWLTYWPEEPLYSTDIIRLKEANLTHRYIRVEPRGAWAFADACKKLFELTGVDAERLKAVGAKMEWFEHN